MNKIKNKRSNSYLLTKIDAKIECHHAEYGDRFIIAYRDCCSRSI